MTRSSTPVLLKEHQPLAAFTTLGVGGPARYYVDAREEGHLLDALEMVDADQWPVFILGGGSNLLVSDEGFPGLVIKIGLKGFRSDEADRGRVTASAGEDWDSFVEDCVDLNLAGIECLSGIPGTVGGTPIQNVGAYGQEVSQTISSVRVLDRNAGTIMELESAARGFAYRSSIFNTEEKGRYVILSASFSLRPGGPPSIRYADLQRRFSGKGTAPTLGEVRRAVLDIRAQKGMIIRPGDPDSRSAGSFFKNPIVSAPEARQIEELARKKSRLAPGQALPAFRLPDGNAKLPAAWLIENAGFTRGLARGKVGLSSKHALAIVNRGGATAREVVDFMREIQSAVNESFGVDLQPEPVFVGF